MRSSRIVAARRCVKRSAWLDTLEGEMNPSDHDPLSPSEHGGNAANETPNLPSSDPCFTLSDIFFGSDGLRALWGILLFLVLRDVLFDGIAPLITAHFPGLSGAAAFSRPRWLIAYEGLGLLSVAITTWIMAKIEHRPASFYGLGGKRRLPNFLSGLVWGVALLSLLVFTLRACGLLVFDARQLFGASALRYGAIWFAGFLILGLFEEYLFRGYLQFTLARVIGGIVDWIRTRYSPVQGAPSIDANALGFWTAALLLSFGFVHGTNPGESPIGLLAAGLVSVVFCLSLWRTGSLWWAIGFHTAWDWAQSFLYGTADSGLVIQGHLFATHPVGRALLSGGLTGPEGSLFILPIVALTAAVIVLTLPRVHPNDPPASADARSAAGLDLS